MKKFDIVGGIRLAGMGAGVVGLLLTFWMLAPMTAEPSGDAFLEGLAVGFAFLVGTLSIATFAGSLAIPADPHTLAGSVLDLTTRQRYLVLAGLCILVGSLLVPLVVLIALNEFVLALTAWFYLVSLGTVVLTAAVGWRGGQGVVRFVRARV